MAQILRVHEQMNLPVRGDRHLSGYNVIFGVLIVGLIQTKEMRVGLANEIGVKRAELPVGTGVAEIESELSGLDLDRHGVGRRWGEILGSPRFGSKNAEGQNFGAHEKESGYHQPLGAALKSLDLGIFTTPGKYPDKNGENELRSQKRDSRLSHGLGHLLVNHRSMGRNVRRRLPSVEHDRNRRSYCDHNDGHRKEFCHDASPLTGCRAGLAKLSSRTVSAATLGRLIYFALKVKSAVAGFPAATVTFWVWVP